MYAWIKRADHPRFLTLSLFVLQGLLAILDLVTTPGIVLWQFNVILILASFFTGWNRLPYILALTSTFVVVLDYALPPYDLDTDFRILLVRRFFGVANFWVVAFATNLLIQYKNYKEELLRSLRDEKTKVQKSNIELERFASVAAHDLRAPLRSMVGWADLLASELQGAKSETKQAIHFIRVNAERCSDLVTELLEMARISNNAKMGPTSLDVVVESVVETLKPEIEAVDAHISLEKLPTVTGNTTQLAAVFTNLIRNALLYSDNSRRPEIHIGSRNTGQAFEIFVEDNGIGIDGKYTKSIFEMFKRLHSQTDHPGTGIGLALCKKIVDLMGGTIWVESVVGKGSTFKISIPKAA